MKTKHILALLTLPVLAACSEDLYTDKFDSSSIIVSKTPAYLTVSPTDTYYFSQWSETAYGEVVSGTDWTMSGVPAWLSVSRTSGSGGFNRDSYSFNYTPVEYTASENTEPSSRTALITVSTETGVEGIGTLTMNQTFTQSGITPEFSAELGSITENCPAAGQSYSLYYKTNIGVSHLSVRTDVEGCYGSFENDKLNVTIGETSTAATRQVYFYIYMDDEQVYSFYIRQNGIYTNASATSLAIDGKGGSKSITFSSTVNWKAVVADGCDWLTVSPETGEYGNDITVTFSAPVNATGLTRSTYVYFEIANGSIIESVAVTQNAFSTSGTTSSLSGLSARGESGAITLTSPLAWTAVPTVDWISVSPSTGKAGEETLVQITAAANKTSSTIRTGEVNFNDASGKNLWQVTVSQAGASITCTDAIEFPARISDVKASIHILSDVEWKVLSKPKWVDVTPSSNSWGDITVLATINEENPDLTSRSGTIEFGLEGTTITARCVATQLGRQMVSGVDDITVDWREHSAMPLEIEVQGEWVAAASENWIQVSPASGSGNSTLYVTIEPNYGSAARRAIISITSEGVTTNIPVNQGGRILNIETTAGEIGAMGGSTEFSVSSTVDYTTSISYGDNEPSGSVLPTDGWLTLEDISAEGVTAYRVTATANPSVNPRTAYVELISSDITGVKFTVTQRGRDIRLSALEISISGNGGTTEDIVVDADGEYSVTTEDTWFSIIKGTNNNFHLAVTPNTTGANRRGTITVSLTDVADGESKSVTVTVKQSTSPVDFDLGDFGSDQDWN